MLVALLVCLIPTTIGALLSAIGIAGMDRLVQHNVLAMSGRAVEAAGDVDTLLLDKTGTITLGNRQATEFLPAAGVTERSWPTRRSWRRWPTRRPRAARSSCWPRRSTASAAASWPRMKRDVRSVHRADADVGRRLDGRADPQGRGRRDRSATSARTAATCPPSSSDSVERIASAGGTPLVVAERDRALGVIHLKDIVKGGMRERFASCGRWASRR